jgi:hypothetical protein
MSKRECSRGEVVGKVVGLTDEEMDLFQAEANESRSHTGYSVPDGPDPRTACVSCWVISLNGGQLVQRSCFWFDPEDDLPAIEDEELRAQHPQIGDMEWQQFFYAAFERGQRDADRRSRESTGRDQQLWDGEPLTVYRAGRLSVTVRLIRDQREIHPASDACASEAATAS